MYAPPNTLPKRTDNRHFVSAAARYRGVLAVEILDIFIMKKLYRTHSALKLFFLDKLRFYSRSNAIFETKMIEFKELLSTRVNLQLR